MSASPQARTSMTGSRSGLRAIPRGVWALGFVSLFMDTSSELIHSLLPVFLVSVLGASMTSVGLIEGVAEAMALIAKIFSGPLSDYLGRRKALTVLGYGFAAITKPLFSLADPVDEPRGQDHADGSSKGEQRFCDCREPIPKHGEGFATAQVVAEWAGEDLGDERHRLGNPLNQAD